MPAQREVYQDVLARIQATATGVPAATQVRLGLLVTGMLAAKSAKVARIAEALHQGELTAATQPASIERRLRRTLNDPALTAPTCYDPVLGEVIDWAGLVARQGRIVLIVDESSQADHIHLLRLSLAYRGGALPLVWAVWEQNVALPAGAYWTHVDALLARLRAVLPAGIAVVVVADRAYAVPNFVDRLTQQGWRWVIRLTSRGSHRWRDRRGREQSLAQVIGQRVKRVGWRWKACGDVFKDAGWRAVSLVAAWAPGEKAPLVVITDFPPAWAVLRWYDYRFWTEPAFRNDKTSGWQWEASQVQGVAHHRRLLLAMAWASLIVLTVGAQQAQAHVAALARRQIKRVRGRPRVGKPQHARASLFTMGLRALETWFKVPDRTTLPWHLPDVDAPGWNHHWLQLQSARFLALAVRP